MLDPSSFLPQLAELQAWAAKMADVLKAGRVAELLAAGEHLLVRPATFIQPSGKDVDPVFGLTYSDWRQFRAEGFAGWQTTTAGSGRAKIIIHTDLAEQWLEARRAAQAAARPAGVGTPASAARKLLWKTACTRPGRKPRSPAGQ